MSTKGEITEGIDFLEKWGIKLKNIESILSEMAKTVEDEEIPAAVGGRFKLRNTKTKISSAFRTVDALLGAVTATNSELSEALPSADPGLPLGKPAA